jgi:hypothetical protein
VRTCLIYGLCEICDICDDYVISLFCLDGMTKTNKKGYTGHFGECQGHSTRQRRHTWAPVKPLCWELWPWHSAKVLTKRSAGDLFAESHLIRSKGYSLPSGHSAKVLPPWRRLFFAEYLLTLVKVFAECPIKSTRQKSRCWYTVRRTFFAGCHTRQSLRRVFSRFCRVL